MNKDPLSTTDVDGKETNAEHEPKYMKKVKDLHGQLRSTVSSLSEKIGLLLESREKDFLAAYRHHMYNVQKELQEARQRVKEAENAVKNNNEVRKLKQECDWFRRQAVRLDELVKDMKQKVEEKETEIAEAREDQKWLERQLKNSKKRVSILRAELESRGTGSFRVRSPKERLPPATSPKSRMATTPERKVKCTFVTKQNDSDTNLDDRIRKLTLELRAERKMSRALKTEAMELRKSRGGLETFFLRAIEETKEQILKRKSLGKLQRPTSDPQTLTSVSLEQFTKSDRCAALESFVLNQNVVKFLHEHIFSTNGVKSDDTTMSPLGLGSPKPL